MRKYQKVEPDRWRAILGLTRWQLDLRIADLERARERGIPQAVLLRSLQDAYDSSRFLHRFLGYSKETVLEQRASQFLRKHQE